MIKEYKKAQLVENFNLYNSEEPATLRGYVEREAENDPNFFDWLFDNGDIESYADLADEQKQEYKEFLDLVKMKLLCISKKKTLKKTGSMCLILQRHTQNMTL